MILQAKILLIISAFLPLINFLINNFAKKLPKTLASLFDKAFPALFLAILIGIINKGENVTSVNLFAFNNFFSFSFILTKNIFLSLALLGVMWLILSFYFKRLFGLLEDGEILENYNFLLIIFSNLIFLIISKTLFTAIIFFILFLLINYYFLVIFFRNDKNATRLSLFFSGFSIFLLILAIILSWKIGLNFDFAAFPNLINQQFSGHLLIAFLFYFSAFLLWFLLPIYLFFFRKINFSVHLSFIFIFVIGALPNLILFCQILAKTLYFENLQLAFSLMGINFVNLFILVFLTIFAFALAFAKNLENIFFYLLLQRILFAFFALIFFSAFVPDRIYLPLTTISLEVTLSFLVISNLSNYLIKIKKDKLIALFYSLPINALLLLVVFLSISGFCPSLGMIEKFYLLKFSIINSSYLALLNVAINSFFVIIFSIKFLLPLFLKNNEKISESQIELAKDFDFDSDFMFGSLILAAFLLLGFLFFPWLINIF